eukprot:scaffold3721_cov134-Isochrysis_galbana.AAC.8
MCMYAPSWHVARGVWLHRHVDGDGQTADAPARRPHSAAAGRQGRKSERAARSEAATGSRERESEARAHAELARREECAESESQNASRTQRTPTGLAPQMPAASYALDRAARLVISAQRARREQSA